MYKYFIKSSLGAKRAYKELVSNSAIASGRVSIDLTWNSLMHGQYNLIEAQSSLSPSMTAFQ